MTIEIKETMNRLNLTPQQMADYLGVPPQTLHNWLIGAREPNVVLFRLLEVLSIIEVMAPNIHANLIPARRELKKRGRKTQNKKRDAE